VCVEVCVFKLVVCGRGSLCVEVRERDVGDKAACERTVFKFV